MKVQLNYRYLQGRVYISLGEPLSAEEANQLLSKANGFTQEAKYSAEYIATGSDSNYIGAEISRITTSGAQAKPFPE